MAVTQPVSPDLELACAVQSKDVKNVCALLAAGHASDVIESWGDSLLHYLVHEYQVTRSTQGPIVLEILESLLKHGANPEHVGANNWRAIDLSIEAGLDEVTNVFVRYGASRVPERVFMIGGLCCLTLQSSGPAESALWISPAALRDSSLTFNVMAPQDRLH